MRYPTILSVRFSVSAAFWFTMAGKGIQNEKQQPVSWSAL